MLLRELTAPELLYSDDQSHRPALEPALMSVTVGTENIWSEGLYYH